MRRYLIFAFSLSIFFMGGTSLIFAQRNPDKLQVPTGDMVLTAPSHSQTTMSPVAFPHSRHFGFSCKSCHHEWDQVSPVKGCASSGCHEKIWASPPGTEPLGEKRIKSLTGAYHNVCRECHRSQLKEQKATGPVTCGECHPAKKVAVKKPLEPLEIPLGTLTLTAPEGSESKRPPVEFPHGGHFNYSCQTCHHDWDGESPVQNCTVSGCHDQLEADEKTRNINAPENSLYFLAAYHKACIQCHRDLSKQRVRLEKSGITDENLLPGFGPVVCSECHSEN